MAGRELTPQQQQGLLQSVTTRNNAVQAAQEAFRQGAQTIVGNTERSQLTDAQRQQLRDLETTRNAAIRSAQDAFRQNAATALGQSVDQLNSGVEALNTGRQIERATGRALNGNQNAGLRAAVSTRNSAIRAAQDAFRQGAQTILGTNTDRSQLTDAQRQQLRDLETTRNNAIRAAQETFRQNVSAGVGMSPADLDRSITGNTSETEQDGSSTATD